jgi:uncharacterized SAM-binding protein YcdF (DUF218 family)
MDGTVIRLAQELWNYLHLNLPLEKADCIIGLGSYDLRVVDRCVDLYKGNWAPFIVFSGHLGNWTKGMWDKSEAEIFAGHAIAGGIPANRIKLETRSTNIGENIKFTRELLLTQGIEPKSITIVSKPSTERRVFATCQRIWPEMKIFITSPQIDFSEQLRNNILRDNLIHEMVGDIQRMKIYPGLGFQIPQDIPDDVWHAYESLISLGYDNHLIRRSV